jgi:hypothetical protein
MLSPGRSQQVADDGVPDAKHACVEPPYVKPACVALVPVVPTIDGRRVPDRQLSRADFVTHLIATAEHAPQTRNLRRATPADAEIAYQTHRRQVPGVGIRMRQII